MKDQLISKIMVVDDEIEYRSILLTFLARQGFYCEAASNAEEALEKQRGEAFDLVVSDIRMQGKDGIQLMRELRQDFAGLEFIIMTGYAAEYSYSDIIDAGATDFIAKPFEMARLKAKIDRIEREKRILVELKRANRALQWESRVNAAFAGLSKALISPLSFEDMSRIVLDCAKDLTESEAGSVFCREASMPAPVSEEEAGSLTGQRECPSQCVTSDCLPGLRAWFHDSEHSVVYNSPEELPDSVGTSSTDTPIRRLLSSPALMDGKLLGQIVLANAGREYSETDVHILGRLADIYALAVHRKRTEEELRATHEELRRARDELQRLLEERTARLSKAGELLRKSIESIRDMTQGS